MKRFLVLFGIFICSATFAHTINWHVDENIYQTTTCSAGDSVTPPTAPSKYGYHFVKWTEYIPIEYLESTGKQWIDTGIYANGGSKIEIKGKVINDTFWVGSISNRGTDADANATRNDVFFLNGALFFEKLSSYNNKITIDKTKIFTFIFDTIGSNYIFTLNGTRVFSTSSGVLGAQPNTINIGYGYWESKIRSGRYYYMKIWDSTETLVRDFIPVLDPSGTPCMYDKVTRQFFYNQGTGDFIAGPVVYE